MVIEVAIDESLSNHSVAVDDRDDIHRTTRRDRAVECTVHTSPHAAVDQVMTQVVHTFGSGDSVCFELGTVVVQ